MNIRSGKAKKIPSPHSPAPRATILGVSIFLMAISRLAALILKLEKSSKRLNPHVVAEIPPPSVA
jgi:hypothetical protein